MQQKVVRGNSSDRQTVISTGRSQAAQIINKGLSGKTPIATSGPMITTKPDHRSSQSSAFSLQMQCHRLFPFGNWIIRPTLVLPSAGSGRGLIPVCTGILLACNQRVANKWRTGARQAVARIRDRGTVSPSHPTAAPSLLERNCSHVKGLNKRSNLFRRKKMAVSTRKFLLLGHCP